MEAPIVDSRSFHHHQQLTSTDHNSLTATPSASVNSTNSSGSNNNNNNVEAFYMKNILQQSSDALQTSDITSADVTAAAGDLACMYPMTYDPYVDPYASECAQLAQTYLPAFSSTADQCGYSSFSSPSVTGGATAYQNPYDLSDFGTFYSGTAQTPQPQFPAYGDSSATYTPVQTGFSSARRPGSVAYVGTHPAFRDSANSTTCGRAGPQSEQKASFSFGGSEGYQLPAPAFIAMPGCCSPGIPG